MLGKLCLSILAAAGQPRSRGSTKRSSMNPMGSNKHSTRLGNIMVGRVVVLLLLAASKAIWFRVEQPKGSLLEGHVLFQAMAQNSPKSLRQGHQDHYISLLVWGRYAETFVGVFKYLGGLTIPMFSQRS